MTLEITQKIAMRGRYKLAVHREDGTVKQLVAFNNLITDFGLNEFGRDSSRSFYMALGKGTSAPSVSDTTLTDTTLVNAGTTASVSSRTNPGSVPPLIGRVTWSQQSGLGTLAGTWTEIGFGPGSTPANFRTFSRALIQDDQGNPTSITILPNEYLTCTYTLELVVPETDAVTVVGGRTLTTRAAYASGNTWTHPPSGAQMAIIDPRAISCYSGTIEDITSGPTGYLGDVAATQDAYVNGSFERSGTAVFGPTQANGTINSLGIGISGVTRFQVGVSPAIVKTNTQSLTIKFKVSWGRAI